MNYLEIAQQTPRNRGVIIDKKALIKYINKDNPLYRSLYLYDEYGKAAIETSGSVADYYGTRWIDRVIVDIDKGNNSNNETMRRTRAYLLALEDEGLCLSQSVQTFFSGSGYHLIIPNSVFNFEPSSELPYIVRKTMAALLPGIDDMVYIRSAIYRVPHTKNNKTNLYKIPLTIKELHEKTPEDILEMAKSQRLEFAYRELLGEGELEHTIITKTPKVKELRAVIENTKVVPCVQRMLALGPESGSRNNTILRIASHFRRHGIPSEYAKLSILHWNQNSLEESVVIDKTEQTYNRGYQYSCQDKLMAKHCQAHCIYFRRKDYLVEVLSAENLQDEFQSRMTTDFSGRTVNLSNMLGLSSDIDATIYPGELVTIFGPTGSSKTTLAQNLALGVDFVNDKIVKEWQIPTLFISLELSAWYMHRRHMQIVSGCSKDEIHERYADIFEEHKDELSHIAIQTVAPNIDQIKEKIRELQPTMVIVDYIDLVDTPPHIRGEYEQIKHISHGLANMAVNYDLIIIQISQVSREYSRNEVLDLYAGKGSGAIENASRKVIGLNGQADENIKNISLYKNTDGELFSTSLEWRPSFRLRRINQ
jgi:archaellum biogenesis ATPase FlaH